jgi:hypothetical protein
VNNNPVRYNDPTGHQIDQGDEGGGATCGGYGQPSCSTSSNGGESGDGGDGGGGEGGGESDDPLADTVQTDDDDAGKCGHCAPTATLPGGSDPNSPFTLENVLKIMGGVGGILFVIGMILLIPELFVAAGILMAVGGALMAPIVIYEAIKTVGKMMNYSPPTPTGTPTPFQPSTLTPTPNGPTPGPATATPFIMTPTPGVFEMQIVP